MTPDLLRSRDSGRGGGGGEALDIHERCPEEGHSTAAELVEYFRLAVAVSGAVKLVESVIAGSGRCISLQKG